MIDLETRIVDCVEQVDADDVERLDLEKIVIEGLEIDIERDGSDEHRVLVRISMLCGSAAQRRPGAERIIFVSRKIEPGTGTFSAAIAARSR